MSHVHVTPSALRLGAPVPNGKLGMWLFLGTEIMFFTAFIGTYIVNRLGSPGWPVDPAVTHINVLAGGVNTFVLICSSVSVVLAHEAMLLRDFAKVVRMMGLTLVLACVFLGIKAVEYTGKFSHDILPGRIAETPTEAVDKLLVNLDRVSGVSLLKQQLTDASNAAALARSGDAAAAKRLERAKEAILARSPVDASVQRLRIAVLSQTFDRTFHGEKLSNLEAAEWELELLHMLFAPTLTTHQLAWLSEHYPDQVPATGPVDQQTTAARNVLAAEFPSTIEAAKTLASTEGEAGGGKRTVSTEEALDLIRKRYPNFFAGVHLPHPILYGNSFASTYFVMTGFHALHVLIGMLMFAYIIWLGVSNALSSKHVVFVENCGLYWHFVDLVWIFLFPLIYII